MNKRKKAIKVVIANIDCRQLYLDMGGIQRCVRGYMNGDDFFYEKSSINV